MFRRLSLLVVVALLAACASTPSTQPVARRVAVQISNTTIDMYYAYAACGGQLTLLGAVNPSSSKNFTVQRCQQSFSIRFADEIGPHARLVRETDSVELWNKYLMKVELTNNTAMVRGIW